MPYFLCFVASWNSLIFFHGALVLTELARGGLQSVTECIYKGVSRYRPLSRAFFFFLISFTDSFSRSAIYPFSLRLLMSPRILHATNVTWAIWEPGLFTLAPLLFTSRFVLFLLS